MCCVTLRYARASLNSDELVVYGNSLFQLRVLLFDTNANAWYNGTSVQRKPDTTSHLGDRWNKYRLTVPNHIATNRIRLLFVGTKSTGPSIDALLLIGQGLSEISRSVVLDAGR